MSALEDLIYGNRGTLDSIQTTTAYQKLLSVVVDSDKTMRNLLASLPDLLTQYDNTIDTLENANDQLAIDYLLEGLRFGILLGMDIVRRPETRT